MKLAIYKCSDCSKPCILITTFDENEEEWTPGTLSCPLRGHASFKRCE